MKTAFIILALVILCSCTRRTPVQFVNPGYPGKEDTVQVRKVIRSE